MTLTEFVAAGAALIALLGLIVGLLVNLLTVRINAISQRLDTHIADDVKAHERIARLEAEVEDWRQKP